MVSHTKPSLQEELAAELRAMTLLHELRTRLLATAALQALLEEVLSATIELQDADFGNVQLYDRETGTLEIVAQRGFPAEFLDYFASVKDEGVAGGPCTAAGASSSRTSSPIRASRRIGRSPLPPASAPCSPRRSSPGAASRSA